MTRRRCSRFASAKVRLFRKPAKDWERFFKKNAKKGCRKGDKWREEGGYTLLYNIYRERKTEPTQEARAEAKFILIMPSNKEEKTAKWD